MEIINLFFVPMVAVALHCRIKKITPLFSVSTLLCYGIYTTVLFISMRALDKMLVALFSLDFFHLSVIYTMIELLIALILPVFAVVFSRYFGIGVNIEKNE